MSLPLDLDFDRDREASPARMNRAMEYLYLRLAAATALQPEFESSIRQLQAVGLERLNEVLAPIFVDATDIAAQLITIRAAWLTGAPLTQLLADLSAQVTARLTAVNGLLAASDAQLVANVAAVTAQLGSNAASIATQLTAQNTAITNQLTAQNTAVDAKLSSLSPTAKWAEATAGEARTATASRLISAVVLWSMQAPVALADAATIAVDLSSGVNFSVTLTANRVLGFPSNLKLGQSGRIRVTQDATGGRSLAFSGGYRPDDNATFPTLNTGANAVTLLRYEVTAGGEITIYGGKPATSGDMRQQTFQVTTEGGSLAKGYWYAPTAQTVTIRAINGATTYATVLAGANGGFSAETAVPMGTTATVTLPDNTVMRVSGSSVTYSIGGYAHVTRIA